MERRDINSTLRAAKVAHLQWRANAQAIIAGVPMDQDKVPVGYTDCRFGRWYYGPGQLLQPLVTYRGIEKPHEMLHLIYMRIFGALFDKTDLSLVQKLFGNPAKLKDQNRQRAEGMLPELIQVSETLLASIDLLQEELDSLSDDELRALRAPEAS